MTVPASHDGAEAAARQETSGLCGEASCAAVQDAPAPFAPEALPSERLAVYLDAAERYVPAKKRRPRKGRGFPAPERSGRIYVRIDPSRVHMFRFLLEAEDNLGLMTVVDRWGAVLLVRFSPHQEREMRAFLRDMQQSLPFTIVPFPPFSP